jgi:hypothetical protein
MEHEHVVVEELTDISDRIRSLVKHLEGDHEKQHWDKACAEIATLLVLVRQRIGEKVVF